MRVTCSTAEGEVVQVNTEPGATFGDVKNRVAHSLGVGVEKVKLGFLGDESIPDAAKLEDAGVTEDDLVSVVIEAGSERGRLGQAVSNVGRSIRNSLSRLTRRDLYEQQLIEREIAAKNIQANMERAFDESPEAFATVLMLYIPTTVNGVEVKAFVDSGAQTTVMSRKCAEKCGIMRLVDPRFAGIAVGVGQARILGRVHLAPIKMGSRTYNCSFTVLDGDSHNMDLLLGLDLLKKHQMMIDLRNDCLHIGDDDVIPFMGESEVPEHARLH